MHLQLFLLTHGTFHRIFQSQVFELIWMLLSFHTNISDQWIKGFQSRTGCEATITETGWTRHQTDQVHNFEISSLSKLEKDGGKKSSQTTDLEYLVTPSTTIIQLLELFIIWSHPVQQWIFEIKKRTLDKKMIFYDGNCWMGCLAQRYIIPFCFKLLGIGLDLSREVSFHLFLCCLAGVKPSWIMWNKCFPIPLLE